jgi:putative hydrolase of the HAD superfamily
MERLQIPPKSILFDLDGTLFDRETSVRELVEEQYRAFGSALAHISPEAYVYRVLELEAHGYVDKAVVYREVAAEFGLPGTLVDSLIAHFWETYASFCRCFPDVPPALASLRAQGVQLGIITNGGVHMQELKIRQLGFAEMFDVILISEREGVRKPDPRIFERAVGRLGVSAAEAWYVGDHPVIDVRGAFDAGMTAVWRYTPYWPRPEVPAREIRGLDELLQLLI